MAHYGVVGLTVTMGRKRLVTFCTRIKLLMKVKVP